MAGDRVAVRHPGDEVADVAEDRNFVSGPSLPRRRQQRRIRTLNAGGPPLGRSEDVEQALRTVTRLMTEPDVPSAVTDQAGAAFYRFFC